MKINLMQIALAMGAMSGAAAAQEVPVSGFVSIGAVQSNNDNYEFDTDYNPWRGTDVSAGLSMDLSEGKSVDVELRSFNQGDSYYTGYYAAYGQLASVGYNISNGALSYGGFAGVYMHNDYYESGTDTDLILGGKVGYKLSEQLSVTGQIGTLSQKTGYYEMGRVNFGTVSANYQMSDALRLAASVGGIGGQIGDSSGETANAVTYSLEAAYRVSGPVEIYANVNGYDSRDADWGNGRTLGLGVKINFGGKSMANGKVADLNALSHMRLGGGW